MATVEVAPPLSPLSPSNGTRRHPSGVAAVAPSTPSFRLETLPCSKEVRVRTTVEQVSNIDLVDQSFNLKLALEASWIDARLKKRRFEDKTGNPRVGGKLAGLTPVGCSNYDPLKVKEIDDEEFFSPRLNFTNMREMLTEEMWFSIFDDSPDDISAPCVVCFRWKLQATFNAELNLVDFPLDIQRLPIHLASYWPARKRLLRIAGKVQCSEGFTTESLEGVKHQLSQAVVNTISIRCNMTQFSVKSVRVSLLPIDGSADNAHERQAFVDIVLPSEHFAKDVSDFAAKNQRAESLFNSYLLKCGGARVTFVLEAEQSSDQPIEFPEQDDTTVYILQNLNRKYTSMIDSGGFVPIEEYDLLEVLNFNPRETNWKSSSSNTVYSELEMQIWCRRKFYNIILPVTLFTLVAFVACLEDAENLADRCSITLTVLLTNVAYKYMIADKLPSVNYLTLIDRYSYFSFLFMFVVVLENAVVKHWETARDAEAAIVIGMLVFWGVAITYYVVKCYWIGSRNDAAWDAAGPAGDMLWIGHIVPRSEEWNDEAVKAAIKKQLTVFGAEPTALKVEVWEGAAANEVCKKHSVQEYQGQTRFAVVRFKDEDEAKEALCELDQTPLEWADPECQGSSHSNHPEHSKLGMVIVEPLHNQWRVLLLDETELSLRRVVMKTLFESARSMHRRLTMSD